MTNFQPPETFNVMDRHGGFTILTSHGTVARTDTLWRPGGVAKRGTIGTLVSGSVNRGDFYQLNEPVISALYKLPGYGYRVKVWWLPNGERLA